MTPDEKRGPGHVLALAGGVGGAKLVRGLALTVPPEQLTVVVNTADDFEHLGLTICPDLDSVSYALAGLNDTERGWGLRDETWQFMAALGRYGAATWFNLGDQDLATHVLRTHKLRSGDTLTSATQSLTQALGIECRVAPMCDEPVRTLVDTDEGQLEFQRYFVDRQCEPRVAGFTYAGANTAQMSEPFEQALKRADLRAIVICPSNPFISIDPMLTLPGVKDAIAKAAAPVVAVTPIVGGSAIKGPAAKMLDELGLSCSAQGIASHYGTVLDGFVLDQCDSALLDSLAPLPAILTDTMMYGDDEKRAVARVALDFAALL
ncbi:MAG: 2-phospho-L-lactate transferase [Chromatiales bacterium]|jgi:LPPG:FO 2-phospho-L-lactate transferase|nr:2-phospho-L-lactate transferase [Chromatiales bacterium]